MTMLNKLEMTVVVVYLFFERPVDGALLNQYHVYLNVFQGDRHIFHAMWLRFSGGRICEVF